MILYIKYVSFVGSCRVFHLSRAITNLNDRVIPNIPTHEQCWQYCIDESSFTCASAEYFVSGSNNCQLSRHATSTEPGISRVYVQTDLYEICYQFV